MIRWDKFDRVIMLGWPVLLTMWLALMIVLTPALLIIAYWEYAWCLCWGAEIRYIIGSTLWGFFMGLIVFPRLFRVLKKLFLWG